MAFAIMKRNRSTSPSCSYFGSMHSIISWIYCAKWILSFVLLLFVWSDWYLEGIGGMIRHLKLGMQTGGGHGRREASCCCEAAKHVTLYDMTFQHSWTCCSQLTINPDFRY
jgi:hypothetical protein